MSSKYFGDPDVIGDMMEVRMFYGDNIMQVSRDGELFSGISEEIDVPDEICLYIDIDVPPLFSSFRKDARFHRWFLEKKLDFDSERIDKAEEKCK